MTAGRQGGAPPAGGQGQGGAPPAPDEAGRVKALDDRFAALEAEQREQRGILDKIASAVGGGIPAPGGDGGQGQGQGGGPGGAVPSAASIAAQVRQEIADADQRRRKEEDDATWRAGVTEVVEKVKAESAPRPPQAGVIAWARRAVLGKDWDA